MGRRIDKYVGIVNHNVAESRGYVVVKLRHTSILKHAIPERDTKSIRARELEFSRNGTCWSGLDTTRGRYNRGLKSHNKPKQCYHFYN